jgi:hypothetical protein
MSGKYICKRCSYSTCKFMDLKRHLNKKTLCEKDNTLLTTMSDDQILLSSLFPSDKKYNVIDEEDMNLLNNSDLLWSNRMKLFEIFNEIDRTKKCGYCNTTFESMIHLRKHIITKCFYKELSNEKNINESRENISQFLYTMNLSKQNGDKELFSGERSSKENTDNSRINNTGTFFTGNVVKDNTINNNFNIYLDVDKTNKPIPFDEAWDISKINEDVISGIITSKYMYTKLLKEILQNEINLNVIMDKDSKTGLVYKDEINKYIKMKSSEIVDNTMEKLKNQLLSLNEVNNTLFDEIKDFSRIMITKKYIDYVKNNNNIKSNVNNLVNNTYLEKKNKAIEIYDNYTHIYPVKEYNIDKKGF